MKFTIDDNHFLRSSDVSVEDMTSQTKTKNNRAYDRSEGLPDTIIMHYTAGKDALTSAKYLVREEVKASAHLVIGREGGVYQLVPFDIIAWHAGRSSYGGRVGYNKYSIGIEMDNAGALTKAGDRYKSWFGVDYQDRDVIKAIHRNETSPRYWHTYTEKQIEVTTRITETLARRYGIKHILGHEEIAPGRKQDPGPAFPLDKFRENILGKTGSRDDSEVDDLPKRGVVVTNKLNIREGAGLDFDKVAQPLTKGRKVDILDEKDGWYEVETTITGWVSKGYIDTRS